MGSRYRCRLIFMWDRYLAKYRGVGFALAVGASPPDLLAASQSQTGCQLGGQRLRISQNGCALSSWPKRPPLCRLNSGKPKRAAVANVALLSDCFGREHASAVFATGMRFGGISDRTGRRAGSTTVACLLV